MWVGDTISDIAFSFEMMRELGAHQVRVMSFVPSRELNGEKVYSSRLRIKDNRSAASPFQTN